MKASELIKSLQAMPPDAEVCGFHFGHMSVVIEAVWLGRDGLIAIGSLDELITDLGDRPAGSPNDDERLLHVWQVLGFPEPQYDDFGERIGQTIDHVSAQTTPLLEHIP